MKKKRMDNRGLTLIELLVSIAIFVIVASAIFGFFFFGLKLYGRTSGETTLQSEAQMTVNRLENLIVGATNGLGLPDTENPTSTSTLFVYNHVAKEDGSVEYRIISVYKDKDNDRLLYKYDTYGLDASGVKVITEAKKPEVISEFVKSFSVDLTKLKSDREVTVSLKMDNGKKTYETSNTFFMRNDILDKLSSNADDYFRDEVLDDQKEKVDIALTPERVSMWQGTTMPPFTAVVKKEDGTPSAGSVLWRMSGNSDPDTTIDANTGNLVVGKNEVNDLTILATAVSTIGSKNGERTAKGRVLVKSVSRLTLSEMDTNAGVGNYVSATVTITGKNFEPESDLRLLTPDVTCSPVLSVFLSPYTTAECSDTTLKYSVRIPRPETPKSLYTVRAVTTVPSSGKSYEDSKTFSFPEAGARELSYVRLLRTDVSQDQDVTNSNLRVNRGDSFNIYMNGIYNDGASGNLTIGNGKEEWYVTNEEELKERGITLTQETRGNTMTYRVQIASVEADAKDQPDTVILHMDWMKTDGTKGGTVNLMLSFIDPSIVIPNVPTGQNRFFLTQNQPDTMTINIKGMLEGDYTVYIVKKEPDNSPVSATISGNTITFLTKAETQQEVKFVVGVKDRNGNVMENLTKEFTVEAQQINTKKDGQPTADGSFIPLSDFSKYYNDGSGILGDKEGNTTELYHMDGTKIVYKRVKDSNGNMQVTATYNGKTYLQCGNEWQPVS